MTTPTPSELRELVARAHALAADIDAAHERLRAAADEPTRSAGYQLPDAAGSARRIAANAKATAGDLARIRGRGACRADWGVCPEHGATLSCSGGCSWCTDPGCSREWNYDRIGLPCTEDVAFVVRDTTGAETRARAGHALAARRQLQGAVVTALPKAGP